MSYQATAPRLGIDSTRCFHHPRALAAHNCSACGRGMCPVCDIDCQDGQHLCPGCAVAADDLVARSQTRLRAAWLGADMGLLWLVLGQTLSAWHSPGFQLLAFLCRYLAPPFPLIGFYLALEAAEVLDDPAPAWGAALCCAALTMVAVVAWALPVLRACFG